MEVESSSSESILPCTPLHMGVGASVLAIPETIKEYNRRFGV